MSSSNRRVVWGGSGLAVIALAVVVMISNRARTPGANQPYAVEGDSPASGFRARVTVQQPLDGEPADPKLIREALKSFQLGKLEWFEDLGVAPMLTSANAPDCAFLSLADAMKQGVVVVEELPLKQVGTVRIRLTKDVAVLGQSGDVIGGGDQDRYIKRDFLIVGQGETRDIAVYCVEPGRWHGNGRFDVFLCPSQNLAQVGLKSELLEAADGDGDGQSHVWNKVRSNLAGVRARGAAGQTGHVPLLGYSETGVTFADGTTLPSGSSIANLEASSEVIKARERYRGHFAGLAKMYPNAVGVAFVAGAQILGIEVFANHRSFAEKWPMLLDAAAVDALQVAEASKTVDKDDLQRFLDVAIQSNVRKHRPIAAGEEYSLARPEVLGSFLFDNRRLLHARLVPQHEILLKHEADHGGTATAVAKELTY